MKPTFKEMMDKAEKHPEYWKTGFELLHDDYVAAKAEIERLNLRVEALSWEILDCPNCESLHDQLVCMRKLVLNLVPLACEDCCRAGIRPGHDEDCEGCCHGGLIKQAVAAGREEGGK